MQRPWVQSLQGKGDPLGALTGVTARRGCDPVQLCTTAGAGAEGGQAWGTALPPEGRRPPLPATLPLFSSPRRRLPVVEAASFVLALQFWG